MTNPRQDAFDSALQTALAAIDRPLEPALRGRMFMHYEQVVEANRQFNLTRITSPAEAAVKHYADSLSLLAAGWVEAEESVRVLDVGTGAGFPAVPLALVCPNWRVTAIDGTGKKARFVAESASGLGLANVETRHARAADLVREGGRRFDVIVVRAVGRIAAVLDEVVPLLVRGGAVVFYKGANLPPDEQEEAAHAAARWGLQSGTCRLELPLEGSVHPRQLIRYTGSTERPQTQAARGRGPARR